MSRSYLFVPADSERKMQRATECAADALILDLEDAVSPDARPRARALVAEFLQDDVRADVWVRINPLSSSDALEDLKGVVGGCPAGIVLPKCVGLHDVVQLAKLLDALDVDADTQNVRILPIVTERPAALLRLAEFEAGNPRLAALTWGAEDLSAALGASRNRDENGSWLPTFELARSLCLIAAATAAVAAVDTVFTNFKDVDGLRRAANDARRDGFEGMLLIHPAQVDVVNECFLPDTEEVERAQAIVALFDAAPDAGVVNLDGEMIDQPHRLQAMRILSRANRA